MSLFSSYNTIYFKIQICFFHSISRERKGKSYRPKVIIYYGEYIWRRHVSDIIQLSSTFRCLIYLLKLCKDFSSIITIWSIVLRLWKRVYFLFEQFFEFLSCITIYIRTLLCRRTNTRREKKQARKRTTSKINSRASSLNSYCTWKHWWATTSQVANLHVLQCNVQSTFPFLFLLTIEFLFRNLTTCDWLRTQTVMTQKTSNNNSFNQPRRFINIECIEEHKYNDILPSLK